MNVLDIFSGIGAFSLGLERAGMRTVAFCEVNEYCRAVLRKHWPEVPCYGDVRSLTADRLRSDGIIPDVICGGFPCQDISTAGKGAGLEGERSGLWNEYARLIGEIKPAWVVIENVSALRSRGLEAILGQLSAFGFDAEWHCIPASYVGAPHRRDRIWIMANSNGQRGRGREAWFQDAEDARQSSSGASFGHWDTEPGLGRVAHGVSNRVDRLRCLGNAIVPQIAEIIGTAIMQHSKATL